MQAVLDPGFMSADDIMIMIMVLTSVGVISGVTVTPGPCYANNGVLGRCWTLDYPVLFIRGQYRPRDVSWILILQYLFVG